MKKKVLSSCKSLAKLFLLCVLSLLFYGCVSQQSERGHQAAKEATSAESSPQKEEEETLLQDEKREQNDLPNNAQDASQDDFEQGEPSPADLQQVQTIERIERKKTQKTITAGEGTRLWQAKVLLPEFKIGTFRIDSTQKKAPSVWVQFVDEGKLIEGKLQSGEVVVESLLKKEAKGKFKGEIAASSEIYVIAGRFQTLNQN
ncbi:hypothetical protein [Hugenholtzia roseola]|uniref:hypothetical protein n=1 Tax=Hugenholtzia roseola TaxID=1002 RepID=UPI00040D38EB|nr:hypothetical protein [Hugenholtzia roseola]